MMSHSKRLQGLLRGSCVFMMLGLLLAPVAAPSASAQATTKMYKVTVTNLTAKQVLSPPLIATHSSVEHIWQVGGRASEGVKIVAEEGDNKKLIEELKARGGFILATADNPLMPGASVTLNVSARDGDVLSAVTMLVQTNDAFTGLDNMALSGAVSKETAAYDAGTEENTELATDVPGPPFKGMMHGPQTNPQQPIALSPGISGKADVGIEFNWSNPVARYAIEVLPQNPPAQNPQGQAPNKLDWPYYGNDLGGMRFQDIDAINAQNVAQLKPAWIFHSNVANMATSFEAQPIVVDGVMYVSSPHDHVFALDAATGALKWTYSPTDMPKLADLHICCGQVNRGVAVGGGKVFIGRLDAMLVALDANSGQVVWQTPVDDWHQKWTETMAPQYVDGKVIIGGAGGEFQVRGHVSAYDANSGKMLWRFYTVPGPGEPGNNSWAGDSWQRGGATVWTTPSVDPALGMVYITTGNAAPDENGAKRAGDNLYSASVVALDINSGQYKWHFQEVHHDLWDYDSAQPAHLFTMERNGQSIPAIGHANKNGFYFVLDRRDGTPLYNVKEMPVPAGPAYQNASKTQPVPDTEPLIPHEVAQTPPGMKSGPIFTPPQPQPILIQPGYESGPEWTAAAYSPRTKYAYIPAGGYAPWLYQGNEEEVNSLGSTGAEGVDLPGVEKYGLFDAMDTTTGKIAWKVKTAEKTVSGVVVTGDVVFFGEGDGTFKALDARTGAELWKYKNDSPSVGGSNGSPAAYVVNGREYVVQAFGGNARERADYGGKSYLPGDALIAFALPQPGQGAPNMVLAAPQQVETGMIPDAAMMAPLHSAPAGAQVVTLETHDFNYYPSTFAVAPGRQVAVHIVNVGVPVAGFAIKLPTGPIALKGAVKPKEDAYFVFTAPSQPGNYEFFSPLGAQRFFGMKGMMTVSTAPAPAPNTPGMPRTGAGSGDNLLLWLTVLGMMLLSFGALFLKMQRASRR